MSDTSMLSEVYDRETQLRAMLEEAISLLPDTYYQPPHFNHEPTTEEKAQEEQYLNDCKIATNKVRELAESIHTALTGKYLT